MINIQRRWLSRLIPSSSGRMRRRVCNRRWIQLCCMFLCQHLTIPMGRSPDIFTLLTPTPFRRLRLPNLPTHIPDPVPQHRQRTTPPRHHNGTDPLRDDSIEAHHENDHGAELLRNNRTLRDQRPEIVWVDIHISLQLVEERGVDPVVRVVLLDPEELPPGLATCCARSGGVAGGWGVRAAIG